jgi:photosystem II stability/assembly factor-like uncharacterized protein
MFPSPVRRSVLLLGALQLAPFVSQSQARNQPQAQAARFDTALYGGLRWREIGPFRGGRVTAVAGHADQLLTYYFGGVGGGVWKTTDGGLSWQPVSDSAFRSGSIGAIAVAPSDPNVIYVGTGESPLRGNVSPGDGMYRSTDAGKTWTHVGLRDAGQIADIEVHPRDENLAYAAVLGHAFGPNPARGVYRTRDGGRTWDRILFRSDSAGAIDLAMDPSNPRIIYAAFWQAQRGAWFMSSGGSGSGLFKTTDGGDTWVDITRRPGLPKGVIGKIGITVAPARPERVWAIVEAEDGGVFRSDDAGATWRRLNEDRNLRQRAWYYTHIHADPKDPETVYVLNVGFWRSVDGGRTFATIGTPHGDNHALWVAPNDPNRMIEGNDGGANVSLTGGTSWTTLMNQPTAQFYHVTTTTHFPYRVCGAQQDNSTVCIASRSDGAIDRTDWYEVGGGESGYISARADDPDIVFAGSYGGYLSRYDHRNGQTRNVNIWPDNPMGSGAGDNKYRFQWTFPIVHSPQNPNVLYASAQMLFKSANDGQSWEAISGDLTRNDRTRQGPSGGPITKDNTSVEYYNVIFTVAPSPLDSNTVWTGSDDGLVHVTRDGGRNWTNVTPRDLGEALISIIEVSHYDAGTAYVAATRYKFDDFRPYIYKTTDYGRTWRRVVAGIPDNHFIRVVREDPARRGLLYAGGEFGIYVSFDDGGAWQSLRLNLPVVPIHDLAVKENDLIAATHGRSFWILDDLTPLQQLTPEVARSAQHLFKPRDVWRTRGGGGFGGAASDEARRRAALGANPPAGAVVYFWLRQVPDSEVAVEFLTTSDSILRRLSTRPSSPADSLRLEAGMNRAVWNLRVPDARRFDGMILWAGNLAGPVVVPDTYKVRLRVGGWSATQTVELKPDPRVATTQADLQRQYDFLIRIRNRVSDANDAVRRIRTMKDQIDGVAGRARRSGEAGRAVAQAADSVKARLSAVEEEIYQVRNRSSQDPLNYPIRLNNKLAALNGVVASADAPPTNQSVQLFDELSAALQVQLDRLKAIIDTDIPALNQRVRALELPAVTAP